MSVTVSGARLYCGEVLHRRLAPAVHAFRQGVFFLRLRIDGPEQPLPALCSRNRWNLCGFYDADHGPRDGSPLEPWIRGLLARHGLACADGAIWLQTFPRVLGYVFNPVSFWFCHDRDGALRAVLADPELATLPRQVLGGGSNIVLTGDVKGLVLKVEVPGLRLASETDKH